MTYALSKTVTDQRAIGAWTGKRVTHRKGLSGRKSGQQLIQHRLYAPPTYPRSLGVLVRSAKFAAGIRAGITHKQLSRGVFITR
jgi:hypothetical protein